MAILNFPSNPQLGDQYTGDNGTTYTFDGTKWVGQASGGAAGTNSIQNSGNTVQVDSSGNLVTPAYTFPNSTGTTGQSLKWPASGSVLEWGSGGSTGDITFNASTMRSPIDTTLSVNAYNGTNLAGNLELNPSTHDATLKSVWTPTNSYGTGYWTTAEWVDNGNGNGTVNITGSTTLFYLFTELFPYASNIVVSINGSPAEPLTYGLGYSFPDIVSFNTGNGFSIDPTTVTTLDFTFDTTAKVRTNASGNGVLIEGGEGSVQIKSPSGVELTGNTIYLNSKNINGDGVVVGTGQNFGGAYHNWYFRADGTLVTPYNGMIQQGQTNIRSTSGSINISTPTPTVIWSSNSRWISSVKLILQIECTEAQDVSGMHSQTCEAIISNRGWVGGMGDPAMTVYGVVHTSANTLATFSVQRNLTTNLIEVVATPSVTASGTSMYYSVSSTEITTWD